jgi:hypothetical protein
VILREFLYVDTDKVRSMQAQLDGGIAEAESETTKSDKTTGAGVKGLISHYQEWGSERNVQKSLGDALFPLLEEGLESEGVLQDVSYELAEPGYWTSGQLQKDLPGGSLIRITAMGSMFDTRYVASTFAGFASTFMGLREIGALPAESASTPGKKQPRTSNTSKLRTVADKAPELEDIIPDFGQMIGDDGEAVSATALRAMVRISRGLFTPGLHLNLTPTEDDMLTIGARLQEGRQFLDSDPEVLFARYGIQKQEWTLVGIIGHHGSRNSGRLPQSSGSIATDTSVKRGTTAQFINSFLEFIGSLGFADLPQYPGFSVVPLAVYRLISPNVTTQVAISN